MNITIKNKNILFLLFTLIIVAKPAKCQIINATNKDNIKTVLIYKKGWQLSFPIININSEEKIVLSFDELSNNAKNYSWKIVYCNSNWTASNLDDIDYINGFSEGSVSDYQLSKNTKVNYINYKVSFPNDKMSFRKSGNYIVEIFDNNYPEIIVLSKRFYVLDNKTRISGYIFKQPLANVYKNQTVNFSINYPDEIINPYDNIKAVIIKNGEAEINTTNIKPQSFDIGQISFKYINKLAFPGVNEYRHFDVKSMKFLSDRLEKIDNANKYYKVKLRPDEILSNKKYEYKPDLNGKRFIKLENSTQSDIEADYCMVTFRLKAPINLNNGDYYVFGALSNWQINKQFKMQYTEQAYYTTSVLLKQGYYNYRYIFNNSGVNIAEESSKIEAEGNFYQTENDYYILCYYKNPIDACDELIGFLYLNTEKNTQ